MIIVHTHNSQLTTINANEAFWLYSTLDQEETQSGGTTTTTSSIALTNPIVYVPTGSLSGSINSGGLGRVLAKVSTEDMETLWITSDSAASSIPDIPTTSNNEKFKNPFITRKVPIVDGRYSVDNLPSGAYSLIYANRNTNINKGVKFDQIVIAPNQSVEKNVASTDVTAFGSTTMTIASLSSGSNIVGATVRLNELNVTDISDSSGIVSFTDIPAGSYSVTISADNFVTIYKTFNISSGSQTNLQTIELNSKKGKLSGQVIAQDVEDYSNILVYAKSQDNSVYTTLTNSLGYYIFPALPVEDGYSVVASAHDFQMAKVDNISIENSITTTASTINLKPYPIVTIDTNQTVTVGTISGYARFADINTSLKHAGIIVSIEGTDYEAITSRDGSYILNNIPQGNYTVNFTDSNHLTQTQTIEVIIGTDHSIDDISLLPKTGNLTSKVIDEAGNAVSEVFITVITPSQTHTATTDSNGIFTINGILAGEYEILASKGGYGVGSTYAMIIQNQTTDIISNPIVVTRKLLTGQINLQNTTDNAGVTIALIGSNIPTSITNSDGYFTLYGVGAGNYQLQITKSGFITQSIPLAITSDDGYDMSYTIELEMSKSIIEGVATLNSKLSSSGIKVEILGTDYFTYTDSVGKWAINVSVGNYSDGIKFSKDLFESKTINQTATVVENGSFSVASTELSQISSNLIGQVIVVGQTDYSSALISINGTSGDADGVTSTINPNIDGTFSISNLPFGGYSYTITYPDGLHESVINSFILDGSLDTQTIGTISLRVSYVKIDNDAIYTKDRNITLSLGNTDAYQMEIVEGGVISTRESFSSTKEFLLSSGDGEKSVTINLYDRDNNPLPSISDTIILDTTLNVSSFTLSGASKKGDILKLSLNLGEIGARVTADIPSIIDGLIMLDNGTGGDTTANDGIYERTYKIETSTEHDITVTSNIIDIAGNTQSFSSDNKLILSTSPSIENLQITSNIVAQSMSIEFTTDEPTTSIIYYGASSDALNTALPINNILSTNHSITLTNLTANALTYFQLEVKDASLNTTTFNSQSKLAPPSPSNMNIAAGDEEIGIVWDEVITDGVIGYNIYRSDNGNPFIKANESIITNRYYLNDLVANDINYTYKLTTVDDSDNESEQSSAVSATASSSLAGPTEINGGVIDKNTIWLSSRSPYNITSDMKVGDGNTLLLLPGTQVSLSGDDREILVDGSLLAKGSTQNRIYLNVTNITSNSNKAGYFIQNLKGEIEVDYTIIEDVAFFGKLATIKNTKYYFNALELNDNGFGYPFPEVKNIISCEINATHNQDVYYSFGADTIKDSKFNYSGSLNIDANHSTPYSSQGSYIVGINLEVTSTFDSSSIENGYIDLSLNSTADNSLFTNTQVYPKGSIKHGTLDNCYILDSDMGDVLDITYSKLINIIKFQTFNIDINNPIYTPKGFKLSHNYWGMTDINTITSLINYKSNDEYTQTLYPIISSSDIFNADFDNDGIPDYIDNDNDNDGYSDLQEDKESDPQYSLTYNPLDANSHPNSERDNDYDGIIDSLDDDDGLTDTEEVNYQTNPMIADSDGDGVEDRDEIIYKYDPVDKLNSPIVGDQSDIHIDGSNVNSDGVVYIIGVDNTGLISTLTNITIVPGTKLVIEKDTKVTIKDSTISGTGINPIIVNSNGAGNGRLNFNNTNMSYAIIKLEFVINIQHGSNVNYSDIEFTNMFENLVEDDSMITQSSIHANDLLFTNGKIENCYIKGPMLWNNTDGIISNSYIVIDSPGNSGKIENSYISSVSNNNIINNSIIGKTDGEGIFINSDIKINSDTNDFFNGTFIGKYESESYYDGLGIPEDQMGDGIATTVFEIDGTSYTVDGITNPRSTKNFPDWVSDPSIKQYFWDPTNVGCLWDKNNPDIFPEP